MLHANVTPEFQLLHTPAAFNAERIAWRFVIYLNLLRSIRRLVRESVSMMLPYSPPRHIRRILDAISPEHDTANDGFDEADEYDCTEPASIIISRSGNGHAPTSSTSSNHGAPDYERYLRALTPLLELEHQLMLQLSDPKDNEEHEPTHLPEQQPWKDPRNGQTKRNGNASGGSLPKIVIPSGSRSLPTSPVSPSLYNTQELSVRAASGWKKHLALPLLSQSQKVEHSGELRGWWENPNDPVHVIHRCAPAMIQLWKDPKVRQKLSERRLRLEESSGLYVPILSVIYVFRIFCL